MKLTVHLIAWNGAKYIPYLFASLRTQTFTDWSLMVVDNHSEDGTVEAVKKELQNFPVKSKLIENEKNLGFAPGHNLAFKNTNSEYFLLLNQDMFLESDCLEKMVDYLDQNHGVSAVSPRLMRWNFSAVEKTQKAEAGFSNLIDALGLKVFKSRRVIEQCTGEVWSISEYKDKTTLDVFGVSGAFPMLRRKSVEKVLFRDGGFLDEDYHSYKEDVDLAWRLQQVGESAVVLLDAVAYHDRSGAGPRELGDRFAIQNKVSQSSWVRYHSYKNHLRTLYKNEYWQNVILDFPWILWYELKKFVWFLFFDRTVLAGLREVWQGRANLCQKRAEIVKTRQVGWSAIRQWWKNKEVV
ncbi:MAG: glycosyltransferase family 2 protein [bacterium]|nr:glycosyltransferase family 2 protein [bacterium]